MMDYEQKYKDLMRDINIAIEGQNDGETKVVLQNIKERNIESEDERIRKRLVEYFNGFYDKYSCRNNVNVHWEGIEVKKVLAYLEKQKEQKSAEWSEGDEENFKWFDKFFRAESIMVGGRDIPQDKYLWFKSLRPQPKQEWSEEEKKKIANIMMVLMVSPIEYAEEIEFLKSLRPQPHWKPSEEQMRAVFDASERNDKLGSILRNLYSELKKL